MNITEIYSNYGRRLCTKVFTTHLITKLSNSLSIYLNMNMKNAQGVPEK